MRYTRLIGCFCLLLAGLVVVAPSASAQGDDPGYEQLKLYPGEAPGEPSLKEGQKVNKMSYRRGFYFNIHEPTIDVYRAKGENRTKVGMRVQ